VLFLCGTDWIFKHYLDELWTSKGYFTSNYLKAYNNRSPRLACVTNINININKSFVHFHHDFLYCNKPNKTIFVSWFSHWCITFTHVIAKNVTSLLSASLRGPLEMTSWYAQEFNSLPSLTSHECSLKYHSSTQHTLSMRNYGTKITDSQINFLNISCDYSIKTFFWISI
jgi:hypothetical protein